MKKRTLVITAVATLLFNFSALAMQQPRSLATDPRIKVVAFQPNNVVPIHATDLINTQIIFGEHEVIINYQSGDPAAWTTDVNKYLRNVLNIKPTIIGSKTDLDVITLDNLGARRYYRFDLVSSERDKSPNNQLADTYAVKFVYPNLQRSQRIAKLHDVALQHSAIIGKSHDPRDFNWNYSFHGTPAITPIHVFDDGHSTFMQLRSGQPVPAIFAVNNSNGNEAIVNYRIENNYLVIHKVVPQFTLRAGPNAVSSIFNNSLIAGMQHGSRG